MKDHFVCSIRLKTNQQRRMVTTVFPQETSKYE